LDDLPQPVGVCWLPISVVANGGHDLSGYAEAAEAVVSGDLVGDYTKEWGQRLGVAADPGLRWLPDRLDVAAQIAAGDGATGSRAAQRSGGSG